MKRKKLLLPMIIFLMFVLLYGGNVYAIEKVSCGNVSNIPAKIPELTHYIINLLQVAVPIILVIFGSIDLFKGIMASKEDEIKKGQQIFVKRLLLAVSIFFVVVIVKVLVSIIDGKSHEGLIDCIDCFISSDCSSESDTVNCELGGYYFVFNSKTGNLVNVMDASNVNGAIHERKSDFKVTSNIGCPTNGEAYVDVKSYGEGYNKKVSVHLKKR